MANLLYLTGDPAYYNLLARATITPSTMDALFGVSNLYDGEPGTIAKYAAAALDREVKADLSWSNGNLDTWALGAPTGWTKLVSGDGTITEDTAEDRSGSCARVNAGATGSAILRRDRVARAGQRFWIDGWAKAAVSGTARVTLQDLRTGLYLNPSGDWVPGPQFLLSTTSTSYVQRALSFQVASYATERADTTTLRLELYEDSGVNAFYDDWHLYPGVRMVSVHGHNMPPALALRWRWSDDDASYTTVSDLTPADPAFYGLAPTTLYHRWWKIIDLGTPTEAQWKGEVVLADPATAVVHPQFGYEIGERWPQVRNTTRGRVTRVTAEGKFGERTLRLPFGLRTAGYEEVLNEWHRRSEGGRYPMVLIPLDTESVVMQGRLSNDLAVRRAFLGHYPGDVFFEESALPAVVA